MLRQRIEPFRATSQQIQGVSRAWDLREARGINSSPRAEVFVCQRSDGTSAVIKFARDPIQLRREAEALKAWRGLAEVVDLAAYSPDWGAILLPHLHATNLQLAGPHVLRVLRALTTAETEADGFPPLVDRVATAFTATHAALVEQPLHEEFPYLHAGLLTAEGTARQLAAEQGVYGLVHADLHPDNIIVGSRNGRSCAIVIDPMPHVGDRTFDVIDTALQGATSMTELELNIDYLSMALPHISADRLLEWCVASGPVLGLSQLRENPSSPQARFKISLAADS